MSRHDTAKKKKSSASRRRQRPVWMLFLMHVLALGVALVVYALPHHVIPRTSEAVGTVSTRAMMANRDGAQTAAQPETAENTSAPVTAAEPLEWDLDLDEEAEMQQGAVGDSDSEDLNGNALEGIEDPAATLSAGNTLSAASSPEPESSQTPEPTATPEPTPDPTEEPVDEVGSFRIKFADKFTDGEVKKTKSTYKSENLNIKISKVKSDEWDTVFYVVDIYVADISCFRTAFAQNKFGVGYTDWPRQIAKDYKSIITMNGDQYGMRKTGVVIRNGTLYRNKKVTNDVCVLYWDGTMKTFSPGNFNANWEMSSGAYQAWNFGPMLLDENGNAKTKFNSNITDPNPRSALGYFEPGHYCFVAVDGRNDESDGLSMKNLAKLMEKLGCKQAYNLDGGRTSMLYAGETLINKPADGGRKASDILMILDYVTE